MTDRLYYTDPYTRDFEATVTSRVDDSRRIYLDRTAFYPSSGGQPFDTGELGGVRVTDVVDEGDRIAHLLDAPLVADSVSGRVDWPRRFDHMQQHTGQHLLSAVLADLLGYQTVAVHFGKESSTLDLNAASLTPDETQLVEEKANEIIVQNRPVEISFENAQQAEGLRKPPERSGTIRIITIRELDRSACGGTHVRATGEIGSLLIRKVERVRKGLRLEFLCGSRANRRARADYSLITRLANDFSAAAEELPQLISGQRDDLKQATALLRDLEAKLDLSRARELYAAAQPETTGLRRVTIREDQAPLESLRGLGQAMTSMPLAVFVAAVSNPPAVLLATSPDTGIDAGALLKRLLARVGGRGGGSARLAQGIVPGRAELERLVGSLGSRVEVEEGPRNLDPRL
jgi:alanyl-tRNA synthetase